MDLFFFFQAEDGIRAFHVTGVQTCALPIFAAWNIVPRLIEQAQHPVRAMGETAELASGATLRVSDPDVREVSDGRSEERRVGKERSLSGSQVDLEWEL